MEKIQIIKKIMQKKELSGLSKRIVGETLKDYATKNNISLNQLSQKQINLVVKDIRARLRLLVGRFQISPEKSFLLLNQNKLKELLKTHSSTAERMEFYPKLKSIIKSLNIKSILDLGSGINPIALADKDFNYQAAEINQSDIKLINFYFKKNKIKGKAFYYNLNNIKNNLPKVDLVLLLKVFDVIEKKGHKLAEKIINSLNTKYILISFPTKTLSNAPMNHPQRGWIEHLLSRLQFKYKFFSSKNEIFYLAKK